MSDASVKRSRSEANDDEDEGSLGFALSVFREDMIIRRPSLTSYLRHAARGSVEVLRLVYSAYFADITVLNQYVVPDPFQDLTIERNERSGRVISISDGNDFLRGEQVISLMAMEYLHRQGFDEVIMPGAGNTEVLALPKMVQTEKVDTMVDGVKKTQYIVYAPKARMLVQASPELVHDFLTLDVPLKDVPELIRQVNAVAAKEDLTFDPEKYRTLDSLITESQTLADKQAKKGLFAVLIKASISHSSLDEKINVFARAPSHTLAYDLEFKLTLGSPVFVKGNKAPVPMVTLASLKDDDEVLMSNVSISHGKYQSIIGEVSNITVYKSAGAMGTLNARNNFSEFKQPSTISKKRLMLILEAIARDNANKRIPSKVVAAAPKDAPPDDKGPKGKELTLF